MLKHIILLSSLFAFLTACGGGGSNNSSTPPITATSSSSSSSIVVSSSSSSSSLSSSSSSSSSSINPCNNTGGTIFSECLNANYGFIVGSEYLPAYVEYTETDANKQVQWSVIDTNSSHNKVLDVAFLDSTKQGQISIGYPDSNISVQDLSEFQTGSLSFDIRVLSFGESYNAQAGGVMFSVRTDCVWPCAAHEIGIVVPTLDTWQHIEIPISDMIASGLDITHVNISLVLVPQGKQKSLHLQLDNIQLSKGAAVVSGPKVIYKEDFNNKTISWQLTKYAGNPSSSLGNQFGALLSIIWSGSNDQLRFETTLDKSLDITKKKASFQMTCWKGYSTNFSYQMISTDINGISAATSPNYAMQLNPDQWYQVSVDLGTEFDTGFDAKHVQKIGLQFIYLGSSSASTECQVDTIRITE